MTPIRCICINDSNRPHGFPPEKWVKKGKKYTIIKIEKMMMMGGALGCQLAEIDTDSCYPYTHLALTRFAEIQPGEEESEVNEEVEDLEAELT